MGFVDSGNRRSVKMTYEKAKDFLHLGYKIKITSEDGRQKIILSYKEGEYFVTTYYLNEISSTIPINSAQLMHIFTLCSSTIEDWCVW